MVKSKFVSVATSTNSSVTLTNDTTVDNYTDTLGSAQTRSRTPRFKTVRVVNMDGAGIVYFRVDGTHPTVGGDNAYAVPALKDAQVEVPVESSTVVVRLIASATSAIGVFAE